MWAICIDSVYPYIFYAKKKKQKFPYTFCFLFLLNGWLKKNAMLILFLGRFCWQKCSFAIITSPKTSILDTKHISKRNSNHFENEFFFLLKSVKIKRFNRWYWGVQFLPQNNASIWMQVYLQNVLNLLERGPRTHTL